MDLYKSNFGFFPFIQKNFYNNNCITLGIKNINDNNTIYGKINNKELLLNDYAIALVTKEEKIANHLQIPYNCTYLFKISEFLEPIPICMLTIHGDKGEDGSAAPAFLPPVGIKGEEGKLELEFDGVSETPEKTIITNGNPPMETSISTIITNGNPPVETSISTINFPNQGEWHYKVDIFKSLIIPQTTPINYQIESNQTGTNVITTVGDLSQGFNFIGSIGDLKNKVAATKGMVFLGEGSTCLYQNLLDNTQWIGGKGKHIFLVFQDGYCDITPNDDTCTSICLFYNRKESYSNSTLLDLTDTVYIGWTRENGVNTSPIISYRYHYDTVAQDVFRWVGCNLKITPFNSSGTQKLFFTNREGHDINRPGAFPPVKIGFEVVLAEEGLYDVIADGDFLISFLLSKMKNFSVQIVDGP